MKNIRREVERVTEYHPTAQPGPPPVFIDFSTVMDRAAKTPPPVPTQTPVPTVRTPLPVPSPKTPIMPPASKNPQFAKTIEIDEKVLYWLREGCRNGWV